MLERATRSPHKRRSEVCRGGTVLTSFDVRPVAWRSQNWERAKREGQTMMMDDPVELDEHRGMAALKSTEICRRLHEVQADQAALRRRQEEFERHAVAAPSTTWPEVAAKAGYLIQLFAATPEARDPRRQELIAKVLDSSQSDRRAGGVALASFVVSSTMRFEIPLDRRS
jgi:hypothetical protein